MMKNIALAGGLAAVPPSRIREIADVAFGMDGVLKLHFGESNLPTPPFIKAAAVRAMDEGFTFYTENAGLPGLRQALADKYGELHGVNLDPATDFESLKGIRGVSVAPPEGSFYLFPRIDGLADSYAFALKLFARRKSGRGPRLGVRQRRRRRHPDLLRGRRVGPRSGHDAAAPVSYEEMIRLIRPSPIVKFKISHI
jgi:hypothetical protein